MRYLVPALSFWVMLAAVGTVRLLRVSTGRLVPRLAIPLGAILFELGGLPLHRSEQAVALARWVNARGAAAVAVEQSWQVGGRLYLRDVAAVAEIATGTCDPGALERATAPAQVEFALLKARTLERCRYQEPLAAAGFRRLEVGRPPRYRDDYVLFARRRAP